MVIGGLLLIAAVGPGAETWHGSLEEGGRLRVDPESRRATREGDRRALWDGVHRLEDGSTVIIRDGIAVPTRKMLEAWQARPLPGPETSRGPCESLVARVCGREARCGEASPCRLARQLQQMAREALTATTDPGGFEELRGQCVEALGNAYFQPCD